MSPLISTCCQAPPLGNWHEIEGLNIIVGMCRDCRDHCEFERDDDDNESEGV